MRIVDEIEKVCEEERKRESERESAIGSKGMINTMHLVSE